MAMAGILSCVIARDREVRGPAVLEIGPTGLQPGMGLIHQAGRQVVASSHRRGKMEEDFPT